MKFNFVESEKQSPDKKIRQPASYIRKVFCIEKPVKSAVIYDTALGVYACYLNGDRIGDELLLPGFTNYNRRLQYRTCDITKLLKQGENVIGCVIGDGWYRGCVGAFNKYNVFGEKLKFACKIEILYEDGTMQEIITDDTWMATQDGALRENDLKICENYDARKEWKNWIIPGTNFEMNEEEGWHPCLPSSYPGKIIPMQAEAVLEQESFAPEIINTPDGNTVLDFGQNLAGYVEFTVTGTAGTKVELIMGETLDEDGNFTLKNLQGEGKGAELMPVGQHLTYILKEGKQTYKPLFLISGYRYVLLKNWPEKVQKENFKSIAVYSDLKTTGKFTCSNELINKLTENVRWSQKSNFVDIPTDCPQRERAGWAGDINVFIETANYLTDTRKFIHKWMQDFVDSQEKNGALPYIIPEIPAIGAGKSSAGWSDAIASVPLMQYLFYGETEELEEAYEAVKKYVEYNRRRAVKRHLLHVYKIAPHNNYILDTGFHYGEWLEPGGSNLKDALKAMLYPDDEVATAWFYETTKNLAKMAEILGRSDDQQNYELLAQKIKDAYRREFLINGQVHSHRQCKYVRPLYMGLCEPAEQPQIAKRLNDLCIRNDYKIGTGFLTTYQVLSVLADNGYSETAYRMLLNEECPGWLYEVEHGATTVWEGWDAITPDGKIKPLSMNHYAPGAVVSFLFSHCAGIRPTAPGFKKLDIRPVPGGGLTYAKAEYDSVNGKISSDWKIADGQFSITVEVPEKAEADLYLPDGTVYRNATSGRYYCEIAGNYGKEEK